MPISTPTDTSPDIGDPVETVETPALVVDLDVMDRNVERYATFADDHDVRLRSHAKTHKTPAIAHRQHDRIVGARDGVVEAVWDVQARGKVK